LQVYEGPARQVKLSASQLHPAKTNVFRVRANGVADSSAWSVTSRFIAKGEEAARMFAWH
jgi:hypothetical protein